MILKLLFLLSCIFIVRCVSPEKEGLLNRIVSKRVPRLAGNPFTNDDVEQVSPPMTYEGDDENCFLTGDPNIPRYDPEGRIHVKIKHPKFKTDVLVAKLTYEVLVSMSTLEFPIEILLSTKLEGGQDAGQFSNKTFSTNCPPNAVKTSLIHSKSLSLHWTLNKIAQTQTNVTFQILYKIKSHPQIYRFYLKKPIIKECNLRLYLEKSTILSDDLVLMENCQIWLLDQRLKKGTVVELSRLNVPCSKGYLLFSGIQNQQTGMKKQKKVCGKIEEIPKSERIVYFSPFSYPATLNVHGSPVFTLKYGQVDQCYNLTFTTPNGTYHLFATPELECTIKIHLPYGNKIVLDLQAYEIKRTSECKGILIEVNDGKDVWMRCTGGGGGGRDGNKSAGLIRGDGRLEIISGENKLEMKLSGNNVGARKEEEDLDMELELEFVMSYKAKPIAEIVGLCDFGWISMNHVCITVVETHRVTWNQAEDDCRKFGGHLVSISNDFVETIVQDLILNSPGYQDQNAYWIGASDKIHEGDFRWTDGSPFAFANWFPGWSQYNRYNRQPNDDGLSEQDCIELRRMFSLPTGTTQITSFMWNDRDCSALNYFVCEKYRNELVPGSIIDPWRNDCNKSIVLNEQNPAAVITSPGFPRPYPDNIVCIIQITAPTSYRLQLDFEELVLEDEPTCSYDYLEIIDDESTSSSSSVKKRDKDVRSVATETSNGRRRLCGDWSSKLKLLRHTSSDSKIVLHFATDYSHHFGGFKARVSMRNVKQCQDDRLHSFKDWCYLVVSYPEVSWSTADHICHGINARLAPIYTPEEDDFVSRTIRKNSEYRVGALYWLGAVENPSDGKFEWNTDSRRQIIYANWFPGKNNNNNRTNKQQHCLGIQWTPSQIASYPSGLYWRSHKCDATGGYVCKRTREDRHARNFTTVVNGTHGRITTPDYPERYRNDYEFVVRIIGPQRSRIVVEFERIDLEYQPACLYDNVELIDLINGKEDVENGVKLCGSYDTEMERFNRVSNGQEMLVKFHSDYSISGGGFSLKWRSVDMSACPFQTLTSNEGMIVTPNYPFFLIPNLNCTVTVLAPNKKRIWLEFLNFDLQEDLDEKNSIAQSESESESNTNTVVELMLGKKQPPIRPFKTEDLITDGTFVSDEETLKISFRTGESPIGKGFKAKYKIIDNNVEEKRILKLDYRRTGDDFSGVLRHLNYPLRPANNIDFDQHVIAPVGHVISLEFFNVKLTEEECKNDEGSVEVYDMYADMNGTKWKLCHVDNLFPSNILSAPIAILSYVNSICFRQKSGFFGFPMNGSLQIYNDSNYKEKLKKHHQSPVGFCEPNPCENESKCVYNGNRSYCQCNGHYAGLFCVLTKCELNPCVFGSCELNGKSYKCDCEHGYSGRNCEIKQKPCENNPCENRGVCTEKGNNFHCQCHAWWEGIKCEKRMLHIPYKPLSQRMLEEPFWLGLITVTVVMGVIGLFWCAKRHFPEKIEKLLAEESERSSRNAVPSLRTSLRDQLAASNTSAVTLIPSPGSGNPRTLLGRFGIRKPSILSLTSPRQSCYTATATARTFSLDDLLKSTRRTPSPNRKRNNSTPSKKNNNVNAEKKQILQQLMTSTTPTTSGGNQQQSKECLQMSERVTTTIDRKSSEDKSEVKETKLSDSAGSVVSDVKLEKKVTFARLLNKISAEMNSGSDVEMAVLKPGKLASTFTKSSSTPPSPAAELRSPNSVTCSNQGSETYSSGDLALPFNYNVTDFFGRRNPINGRQKPASADSIFAMFRNWPSSLKPSPSTTPTISSPLEEFGSSSSINTPLSLASMTFDSPSKQGKVSGTIDVPVFDAFSVQKCSNSCGSNLLHPPTILLEIPSTINKCLSPIREMPTPLPSPMPSPAITPIMHRSKASSIGDVDRISIDIAAGSDEDDDFRKDVVIDPQAEDGLIREEAAALQLQSNNRIKPLVIPMLTVQMPSPIHSPTSRTTIGSPPPQKVLPFVNVEDYCYDSPSSSSSSNSNRKSLKPSSLDLKYACACAPPPTITITCNMSEIESDAESISPAIKKSSHHNTSTMSYLTPFSLSQRNDRTVSESNLSSSGYSSMASPGSSRCGSSNPLCPSESDDPGSLSQHHSYHPILGQRSSNNRLNNKSSIQRSANDDSKNENELRTRERSDSETFSDDPMIESNDEGIGTDHIEEKMEDVCAKQLDLDCNNLEINNQMDLLMPHPPNNKQQSLLFLPSIVIQSDNDCGSRSCEKHLSPVSSRSESPLSDKTTGTERFSTQFYGRNKESLPFTDSDGLYDFPSSDKVNVISSLSSQSSRKYTSRRKEKKSGRISAKSPTPPPNLDIPRKDIILRPTRKTSPKRKPRGQQILSCSSSSSDSVSGKSKCAEDIIRWSYSNEEWSDCRYQKTSDEENKVGKYTRDYPKSSEDLTIRPKRISRLRAISHQIRFLRRLEMSLRRRERTVSPSESLDGEDDENPKVTSPLIQPQPSEKCDLQIIKKSKSINFNSPIVKNNRRYKKEDVLIKDKSYVRRVFVDDNNFSD